MRLRRSRWAAVPSSASVGALSAVLLEVRVRGAAIEVLSWNLF
jgi:hypothetical protein